MTISFRYIYSSFQLHTAALIVQLCFSVQSLSAQTHLFIADTSLAMIDGHASPFDRIRPGDTIFLQSGVRDKLLIRNITGDPVKPVTIMNSGGIVTISTNSYYGISVSACRYLHLTGTGDLQQPYGIQVRKVESGAGIGIGNLSSDIELDHVSVEHTLIGGIYAKTEPDCNYTATREKFTQFNTSIHDNYIAYTGNEGLYIGSSNYSGVIFHCNGRDTLLMPPLLNGVKVYNNVIRNTGWDAMQVSSAITNCQIYKNDIAFDSELEVPGQMVGILMGGGSKCECFSNLIRDGKGDGIENHGLGGNHIYDNIIVNAGRSFMPLDPAQMKHGILVSDISMEKDSSVSILFNDIISPKSDGIRFQSIRSRNNRIFSNLIVDPGNFELYETGITSFRGPDAYIMLPFANTDVQVRNNFMTRELMKAHIASNDFAPQPGSPLINTGTTAPFAVDVDFYGNRRTAGWIPDIGAVEYTGSTDTLLHTTEISTIAYPDPVTDELHFTYFDPLTRTVSLRIYDVRGIRVSAGVFQPGGSGIVHFRTNVSRLLPGVYFYSLICGDKNFRGKFIKR